MPFSSAFAILPASVQGVIRQLVQTAQPKKIVLFGSRATGTHRPNSDFDIAVYDKSCSEEIWNELLAEIDEAPNSLYPIEIVEFERLNTEYQKNILEQGKLLYGRSEESSKNAR